MYLNVDILYIYNDYGMTLCNLYVIYILAVSPGVVVCRILFFSELKKMHVCAKLY